MSKIIKLNFNNPCSGSTIFTSVNSGATYTSYQSNFTGTSITISGSSIDTFTGQLFYIKISGGTCNTVIMPINVYVPPCPPPSGITSNWLCGCPPGFTPNSDETSCSKFTNYGTASIIGTTATADQGARNEAYGSLGYRIYKLNGFNNDGTPNGPLDFSDLRTQTFFPKRMDNIGVWKSGAPEYEGTLTFCTTINVPVTKQYYIGLGGDNKMSYTALTANGTILSTVTQPAGNPTSNFNYWHIYPVVLSGGTCQINISNTNGGGPDNFAGPGNFAAEIYDNTLQELTGFTLTNNTVTLSNHPNFIFSTGDYLLSGTTDQYYPIYSPGNGNSNKTISKYPYGPSGKYNGEGFCGNYVCLSGGTLDFTDPLNPICTSTLISGCT